MSIALAVAAAVCLALALPSSGSSGGGSSGRLSTPVWSARRAPELVVDAVGAQRLGAALTSDLATDPTSCYVVAEGHEPLAAANPDLPLLPASTQKLFTAVAALESLGPSFRYETKAVAVPTSDPSTLDRLWLVGAGDPVLATPAYANVLQTAPQTRADVTTSLNALADAIVAKGVKKITGGIVGDDSRYDGQRYVPTWSDSYHTTGDVDLPEDAPDVGPLGALGVNGGLQQQGTRLVAVADPAVAAAQQLTALLAARGVQVGAPSAHQKAPANATPVASVMSPPLHDIVAASLLSSDNRAFELLAKEVGVHATGQGTTAAGTQAVVGVLTRVGVPTAGLTLVDASGLDRGDRATCRALASVIDLATTPPYDAVTAGLPVAGQQGTLAQRLQGTPLAGKLKAKTGTVDGVSGLVGLLDAGRPLRFALLANGAIPSMAAADAVRERFAGILATFPNAPAAALVPAPGTPSR